QGRRVGRGAGPEVRAPQRHGPARLRAARRVLLLPERDEHRTQRRRVLRAAPPRGEGRHGARQRVRATRRRTHPRVLRDVDGEDRRSVRSDRALRGTAAALIDWERAFEKALAAGDPLAASDILRRTGERGWVKKAELVRAAAIVRDQAASSFVRRDWASRLLQHPRRVDKELAAVILRPLIPTNQADVERAIHRLARDDDWEVREAAASLLGDALERSFEAYLRPAQAWVAGEDSRLRRAVVVAAKHAARSRRPERAEPLLDLIEPALADRD